MSEALERLVNLALYLAASRSPVTAHEIRDEIEGYPADQDEDAFLRMFERDKKELRGSGLVISTVELSSGRAYELDRAATFQRPVVLSPQDTATLRAVGAALITDTGFPLGDGLATALAKLAASPGTAQPGCLAVEDSAAQGVIARALAHASVARKRVTFEYETAAGSSAAREVEPYGLFLRGGRWYLVGHDTHRDETRVFALLRMRDVVPNPSRPGTPDFEVADELDLASFARLPFQYGDDPVEAVLEFDPDIAWRAPVLAEGQGNFEEGPSGSLLWSVDRADPTRLARWVIEHGPGIRIVSPRSAREAMRSGLRKVVADHE